MADIGPLLRLASATSRHEVRRILLVLDDSNASLRAADMVRDVARRLGAQVLVYCVVREQLGYSGGSWLTKDLIRKGCERIDDVLRRLAYHNVTAEGEIATVRFGSRARMVIRAADEYDADLIVVGLGLIASLLARAGVGADLQIVRCGRPVLVVPYTWPRRSAQRPLLWAWFRALAGQTARTRIRVEPG